MNMKTLLTYATLLSVTAFSHVVYADNQWPDLPTGFKDGVGAQVGSKVYVGLGSLGKSFYVLDLNALSKGWQKIADFTGAERSGATASVIGNYIYLFGAPAKQNRLIHRLFCLIRYIATTPRKIHGRK